jgi:hypothetical protein
MRQEVILVFGPTQTWPVHLSNAAPLAPDEARR